MAVYTFLESYDWTGKTLVPFNTSASGGFGRSLGQHRRKRPRRDDTRWLHRALKRP